MKIIRTDHNTLPDGSEIRNYFTLINESKGYDDVVKDTDKFVKKYSPKNGIINILIFYEEWAAHVKDYRELEFMEYIFYNDAHPYAYIHGEFLVNPCDIDLLRDITNNEEKYTAKYGNKTIPEIEEFQYMESIKDDTELLNKYLEYKKEKDGIN